MLRKLDDHFSEKMKLCSGIFIICFFILNPCYGREQFQKATSNSNSDFLLHEGSINIPNSSSKRDYVAPQFPTLSTPTSGTTKNMGGQNKVKDLINFYDKKNEDNTHKMPSYSSILQGSNVQNNPSSTKPLKPSQSGPSTGATRLNQPVTNAPTSHVPTLKPLSFSAVVGGSKHPSNDKPNLTPSTNKPGISTASQVTTSHPSTPSLPSTSVNKVNHVSKPGSPILPSAIINNANNKNSQTSNKNGPSDLELQTLSEELLRKDTNNAARYISINYQEKTTSQSKEDKAPLPLLTVADGAWNLPTIQKFIPLLDNYERDTLVNEYVTPQERNEEIAFMDVIMTTSVIRHLMSFLRDKGYVTPDPRQQRDFLKQLWFSLYSRGKGKISSSGFEHIFVSELKNGEVSGLHNWIYFSREETANRVNYLGYLKYIQLNDKGAVMKLHFNQQGTDKPVDSMFIGTSPELEIALYTLCFVTRPDNDCPLKLASKNVNIVTHTFRYRSKNLIGSGYPQI